MRVDSRISSRTSQVFHGRGEVFFCFGVVTLLHHDFGVVTLLHREGMYGKAEGIVYVEVLTGLLYCGFTRTEADPTP